VVANLGNSLLIEDSSGHLYQCRTRKKFDLIVCGDHVQWTKLENNSGVVDTLIPRSSELSRINKQGKAKPLAANIDQLVIVSTHKPQFDTRLIDTYLAAAETMRIKSILIFNKEDLFDDVERKTISATQKQYQDIGYASLTTSRNNLSELNMALAQHISIFVGQSGVGKSTLIQSLIPEADIRIGALSKIAGLGRHTTTTTMLYHLGNGGHLIDSPGVREFIPNNLSAEDIRNGFIEFSHYADQCRFRNCSHTKEPDCAVIEALARKEISASRYNNYQYLLMQSTQ
jgi:ribosome biogenesis GTPase / thiamine phosphate phosphatase